MMITVEEVLEYWRAYCKRHSLGVEIVSEGDRHIQMDHEDWADRQMKELHNLVKSTLA
jgi:hypothetical protein